MNGAQAIVASLVQEGVDVVFGLPGAQIMDIMDAVCQESKIRWITTRHEQTAAYMAYGYSLTNDNPGVVVVVTGPATLNTLTAVGSAYATSTPVLLIVGQIQSNDTGNQHVSKRPSHH